MVPYLPTRADYVEMLGRAREAVADALEEATRTRHATVVLLFQTELADWDRLIARLQKTSARPKAGEGSANRRQN
jgi:hypothetical protein